MSKNIKATVTAEDVQEALQETSGEKEFNLEENPILPIPREGDVINGTEFEVNKMYEITVEDGKVVNLDEVQTVSEKKETVFIYVGPVNKFISRYTIYKNGYPPHFKDQIEEFPILKNLFIHPGQLAEFEKNVNITGSVENIWFLEAKKHFSKAVS